MKIIVYFLMSLMLGILTTHGQEQTTETNSTNSSISISVDGDITFSENENTYFSTIDSDDTYKVRSKFSTAKTAKIRSYLLDELGKEDMTTSGSKQYWRKAYDGATAYEVKVDEGSLRIFVDKEIASSGMLNKFKAITKNIKKFTSEKASENQEVKKAKREQELLEKEAERKIKEAERLQQEVNRLQKEAKQLLKERKNDN